MPIRILDPSSSAQDDILHSVILTMSPLALTPLALKINQGEEEESRGRSAARGDDTLC